MKLPAEIPAACALCVLAALAIVAMPSPPPVEASAPRAPCPPPPQEQSGYQTFIADNLQDLQDATAVFDSAGHLVSTQPVGTSGSCWALIHCDPNDVNAACWNGRP